MKRKTLLVSFVLILVVAGIVGGVIAAQAAPAGQTTGGQRLFGTTVYGGYALAGQDPPPYYWSFPNIVISNPDWQYDKKIEKIVVYNGTDLTLVKEWYPAPGSKLETVRPHEVHEIDPTTLGIDSTGFMPYKIINVDVYWNGRGETLRGWIQGLNYLAEVDGSGNGHLVDIKTIVDREMVNLSR